MNRADDRSLPLYGPVRQAIAELVCFAWRHRLLVTWVERTTEAGVVLVEQTCARCGLRRWTRKEGSR
jgi:hypothetical protein